MNDSDPRPMPPQVLAAYRDPLDLSALFASEVFSASDRIKIRDELLDELIDAYGSVELPRGASYVSVRDRLSPLKKNVWKSIDILSSIEEYGGKDAVMARLARLMEPNWIRWWRDGDSMPMEWDDVIILVLGDRQLRWMSCQCARDCIDNTSPNDRSAVLTAIQSAEAFCIDPSEAKRSAMKSARYDAWLAAASYSRPYRYPIGTRGYSMGEAAFAAVRSSEASISLFSTIGLSARSKASARRRSKNERRAMIVEEEQRLMSLARSLITPTLITHASRGLR